MAQAKDCRKGGMQATEPGTVFGEVLYHHCYKRGMSVNDFGRRVGLTSGFLSGVYKGHKLPPLNRVEGWATELKLRGKKKAAFVVLAGLQHAPVVVRALIDEDLYRGVLIDD